SLAMARNDTAGARKAGEATLKLDPNNIEALGGLAALEAASGRMANARAMVDKRVEAAPNSPSLKLLAAKGRIVAKGKAGAEPLLRRAIDSDPRNLESYTLLGQILVADRKTSEAKQEFTKIVEKTPNSVSANTILGLLCQAEKDLECAIKWYEKAVRVDAN